MGLSQTQYNALVDRPIRSASEQASAGEMKVHMVLMKKPSECESGCMLFLDSQAKLNFGNILIFLLHYLSTCDTDRKLQGHFRDSVWVVVLK